MRLALGAGPGTVIRLMLVENLMLGLMEAAVGILIAGGALEALRAMPPYGAFPVRFQTSLDGLGLLFAVALGIGSGLSELAPALQLGRIDPQRALRSGSNAAGRSPIRDGLMALQCGLALRARRGGPVLRELRRDARHQSRLPYRRLDARNVRSRATGTNGSICASVAAELLDRLHRVPSVDSAPLANAMPLDIHGLPVRGFTLEGRADHAATGNGVEQHRVVRLLRDDGHSNLAGTDFAELTDTTQPPQVIVNEEFVRRYISPNDPIGRRLRNSNTDYTIVGVVKEFYLRCVW